MAFCAAIATAVVLGACGGGVPGVCGDVVPCTGLCLSQKICGATNTTTLTGTVPGSSISGCKWAGLTV